MLHGAAGVVAVPEPRPVPALGPATKDGGPLHLKPGHPSSRAIDAALEEWERWPYRATTDKRDAMNAAITAAYLSAGLALDPERALGVLVMAGRAIHTAKAAMPAGASLELLEHTEAEIRAYLSAEGSDRG